jgi:uncharacterized pyridoxamine 5'-phosphate oxidase family protein
LKLRHFYAKYVQPVTRAGIFEGGLYFAEVPNKEVYKNIKRLNRKGLTRLSERQGNFVRIEIPVVWNPKTKKIDEVRTVRRSDFKTSEFVEKIAARIHENLF